MSNSADIERFMRHVRQLPDGCWQWTSSTNEAGYATFFVDGQSRRAFRWIISQVDGLVDSDLEPDHTCHSSDAVCAGGPTCLHRRCVNPQHGELVTHAENSRRAAYRFPTCSAGHLLPVVVSGKRVCRPCANRRNRAYKARQRAMRLYDAVMAGGAA